MNDYYPGSKSYLLFHPSSPASFHFLWMASLKVAAQRSSLAVFVWKRSENCAFYARLSTKMEPWWESTFCLSGTVVNYTPKCFSFPPPLPPEGHLKVKYRGNGCGLNLKTQETLCIWGRKWNSFGWRDEQPFHLLILFCLNGKSAACERHINLKV